MNARANFTEELNVLTRDQAIRLHAALADKREYLQKVVARFRELGVPPTDRVVRPLQRAVEAIEDALKGLRG